MPSNRRLNRTIVQREFRIVRGLVADLARHGATRLVVMEKCARYLSQRKELTPLARVSIFVAAINDAARKGIPDQLDLNAEGGM